MFVKDDRLNMQSAELYHVQSNISLLTIETASVLCPSINLIPCLTASAAQLITTHDKDRVYRASCVNSTTYNDSQQ